MGDAEARAPPLGNHTETSTQSSSELARYGSPPTTEDHGQAKRPHGYAYQPYGSPFDSQSQQSSQQSRMEVPFNQSAGIMQGSGRGTFNMSPMVNALPRYGQNSGQQPGVRFDPSNSIQAAAYQMQQISQYGHSPMSHARNTPYNIQAGQQIQTVYSLTQQSQHGFATGPLHNQHYYTHQPYLPPNQMQAMTPYSYQMGQYAIQGQNFPNLGPQYAQRIKDRNSGSRQSTPEHLPHASDYNSGRPSSTASASQSSVPRGPPRKPKQSGHALWVGNLPPGSNVVDLKDHFSREATKDIESVFLISKSNCAFINYKSEVSCAAAMTRFRDSHFQGVRLVCRLRRGSVNAAPGVPTGLAALTFQPQAGRAPSTEAEASPQRIEPEVKTNNKGVKTSQVKDKFFIVKSLTVEDLELSARNGIWATQSHNEKALNEAYETAENVYLIFSVNKSGEYFGYARMTSPINNDPIAAFEFAPKEQTVEDPDLPKTIPTPASEHAPKGRIIDDSARGTIFWEAEQPEVDEVNGVHDQEETQNIKSEEGKGESKAWGKPFTLNWLSTNRLPFYRTRGLRNPWNSNREVKIARDGTELETSIGRRLLQMFHRVPSPIAPPMAPMPMIGMPQMMSGYPPHMRYQ